MRRFLALVALLLPLTSAAHAKATELACSETERPDRKWYVTLNEESGTGSLTFANDGSVTAANVPAVFTPNEVRLEEGPGYAFVIDRTTLAYRREVTANIEDPKYRGQCQLASNADRKF